MTAKRILIVEDEKAIRDMVAFGLRRAGYEVGEAEDCREARARIVDVRPDLMLVDWMLPDMSGLELTRSLKRAKDTEEIPVIMLTARAEEQDKVGGLEGGADDYITKPFSPRELLARMQAIEAKQEGTITKAQRGYIYQLVLRWSEAEADRRQITVGAARAACWGTLKARFKLSRYEDLPLAKYAACVNFIKQAYTSTTGADLDLPEQQTLDLE
jgi:two-component system phosphate regulon response regulator PhoB